jgi:hypothetical protein
MDTLLMGTVYAIGRPERKSHIRAVTDDSGAQRFEVHGSGRLSRKLSIRGTAGPEVAVISRPGFSRHYELLADGQRITMRPRGLFSTRLEINSPAARLEVVGDFRSKRTYSITRGGMPAAVVTDGEQFTVAVTDGEDPVLMLGVALTIWYINADLDTVEDEEM